MSQNKENQEYIQRRYMEFQALNEELKQASDNLERVNERIKEIAVIIDNIREISEVKDGTEILVPVCNGIFIKATTKKDDFLVNIGGKTIIKKDKEQVFNLLKDQKKELLEVQMSLNSDLNALEAKAISIQSELQKLIN
jgi:prefoldin alpha subunit